MSLVEFMKSEHPRKIFLDVEIDFYDDIFFSIHFVNEYGSDALCIREYRLVKQIVNMFEGFIPDVFISKSTSYLTYEIFYRNCS